MLPQEIYEVTERFSYLRLRFYIRLQQDGRLPPFKGSLWHGWLGHMIKGAPPLYQLLYGNHAVQQPKPYQIQTDGNRQELWQQDDIVSFDLVLLGAACQAAEQLVACLGRSPCLPLGAQKIPVTIHSIATVTPFGLHPSIHIGQLYHWLQPQPVSIWHEVALQLESPLRMKYQGNIVKKIPLPLPFLLEQIARRLALLTHYWVDESEHLLSTIPLAIPSLGEYQQQGTCVRFEDWQRFSVRQGEQLPFGGLIGQLCYQGDIAPAIPWLQIGQQLQVGGKTTFGLGCYRLIA
ncbi:CRISPR system precrRNA processing endoribonuclease RAMP protein Cas6 [Aeromonas veronii]|uniref:CRISPR system precrRNA processing endoribonuclease RAMP protein Cas6 n=1 Tax=Aeromonas veronii TaxID=654 RepID=UPI0029A2651F|nr:CRISPR system precrRNA processing endoribonuclease RAMP protein Cas6 [Aeromonas veronii]